MAAWISHGGIVPMTRTDRIRESCLNQVGNCLSRSWEISQVVPVPEFLSEFFSSSIITIDDVSISTYGALIRVWVRRRLPITHKGRRL